VWKEGVNEGYCPVFILHASLGFLVFFETFLPARLKRQSKLQAASEDVDIPVH
jgi:hypothetical protein